MSSQKVEQTIPSDIAATLRTNGLAGAGGAGFPSYAKWLGVDDIDYLLVNHQESEPNFYTDKWLLKNSAEACATFFETLLDEVLDAVVVGAKAKDREEWMEDFEDAADATVRMPDELPLDIDEESGIVIAYTGDQFQYGMENVLLPVTAGITLGDDLPSDHGWIVQNTETIVNIYRALQDDTPVTHKYVHIDGYDLQHRFYKVPVGTSISTLLEEGAGSVDIGDDQVLVEGGPGWSFASSKPPDKLYVCKRTNCVMVLDADDVEANTLGDGRVNILDKTDWARQPHETEPTTLTPETVRVPLITNTAYEGTVQPSIPTVEPGDTVSVGDQITEPGTDGVSIPDHASIDGTITNVTDSYVEISSTVER